MDPARIDVAQVFAHDLESFVHHVLAHELDVARADVGAHGREHAPAARQLQFEILATAAELEDVVDQPLHRDVAVARGGADGRAPGTRSLRGVERQHEMIHSADADARVADAGGDAGAEHRGDHLALGGHVVLTGQQARRETLVFVVPVPAHMARTAAAPVVACCCPARRVGVGRVAAGGWWATRGCSLRKARHFHAGCRGQRRARSHRNCRRN